MRISLAVWWHVHHVREALCTQMLTMSFKVIIVRMSSKALGNDLVTHACLVSACVWAIRTPDGMIRQRPRVVDQMRRAQLPKLKVRRRSGIALVVNLTALVNGIDGLASTAQTAVAAISKVIECRTASQSCYHVSKLECHVATLRHWFDRYAGSTVNHNHDGNDRSEEHDECKRTREDPNEANKENQQ